MARNETRDWLEIEFNEKKAEQNRKEI